MIEELLKNTDLERVFTAIKEWYSEDIIKNFITYEKYEDVNEVPKYITLKGTNHWYARYFDKTNNKFVRWSGGLEDFVVDLTYSKDIDIQVFYLILYFLRQSYKENFVRNMFSRHYKSAVQLNNKFCKLIDVSSGFGNKEKVFPIEISSVCDEKFVVDKVETDISKRINDAIEQKMISSIKEFYAYLFENYTVINYSLSDSAQNKLMEKFKNTLEGRSKLDTMREAALLLGNGQPMVK